MDARSFFPDVDRRVAVALAYTALALTLLEYLFIPSAAYRMPWVREFEPAMRSLAAGLVFVGATLMLFAAVPAMVVSRWHREPLASIGWNPSGFARHARIYLGLFVCVLPVIFIAATRDDFTRTYPYVGAARSSLEMFLIWEVAYVASLVATESFFRGYLLFTTAARMGSTAVFVSAVPYVMVHFHKPLPEALGAIVTGIVLGVLALRYRSFWGGILVHALVAVTMDVLAVRRGGLF